LISFSSALVRYSIFGRELVKNAKHEKNLI
jgi:hypothetical protein